MLSLPTVEAAMYFMQRATLQGSEVPAYANAFNELQRVRLSLQQAQASAAPSTQITAPEGAAPQE